LVHQVGFSAAIEDARGKTHHANPAACRIGRDSERHIVPLAAQKPVLATDPLHSIPQAGRLMNLGQVIPPGFSRFQSLIEVVGQGEDERGAARERVKFYKDRGYEVRYFDLSER